MISDKTAKKFLKEMAIRYRKARSLSSRLFSQDKNDKRCVIRGRAHCVAADFEDCFADLLSHHILWKKEAEKFFVFSDFPVSYKKYASDKRAKTNYIDIMVCEKIGNVFKICYMAELKTNTGWLRKDVGKRLNDNFNFLKEWQHVEISAGLGSFPNDVGFDKRLERIEFLPPKYYDLIVLSSTNTDKNSLYEVKEINKDEFSCRLFVLTDDVLINTDNPKPRHKDIQALDKRIRSVLRLGRMGFM